MNFESLIGQTFQEKEFYELLLFDVEENIEQYYTKNIHFYFDRTENQKIEITEIVYFEDEATFDKTRKQIIEKKEWVEINHHHGHILMLLCRFDRSGFTSFINKKESHTEDWYLTWADEDPERPPLTPEEIRFGFLELMGIFQDEENLQNLESKKAI